MRIGGKDTAQLTLDGGDEWTELAFDLPPAPESVGTPIELRAAGGPLTTYHYWFVAR